MKDCARLILLSLLIVASGCTSVPSPGRPVEDSVRQLTLLDAFPRPSVSETVFRTLIRWGKREISLTEVVKTTDEGGVSVAGVSDIGTTLYAAQIDRDGRGRILSKSLPFSDRWLLDGLIADLLIPWNEPAETSQLYRRPDGTWTLVCEQRRITSRFRFDDAGTWRELDRLRGSRLLSRTTLEWDGEPVPRIMRVENPGGHYHAIRERVSTRKSD